MLCPRPISVPYQGEVPCGRCGPCRVNAKAVTTGRVLLEAMTASSCVFVTLTYSEDHVPMEGVYKTLRKKDGQDFMKRLRKRFEAGRIRHFFVGEYGDRTWRPHYHAILFGLSIADEAAIQAAWGKGFVTVAEVNPARCSYVAGYTAKKYTGRQLQGKARKWLESRLRGREPEFVLQSRGLGDQAVQERIAQLQTRHGSAAIAALRDVPGTFRYNGKRYPFSYRHRQMIREATGISTKAHERKADGAKAGCDFSAENVARALYAEARLHSRERAYIRPLERDEAGLSSPSWHPSPAEAPDPGPRDGVSPFAHLGPLAEWAPPTPRSPPAASVGRRPRCAVVGVCASEGSAGGLACVRTRWLYCTLRPLAEMG